MDSEICFSTLEVLHCLLVCLALSFFSHHVCFEKAGIPQKEAGVGLVVSVGLSEGNEAIMERPVDGLQTDPFSPPLVGDVRGAC